MFGSFYILLLQLWQPENFKKKSRKSNQYHMRYVNKHIVTCKKYSGNQFDLEFLLELVPGVVPEVVPEKIVKNPKTPSAPSGKESSTRMSGQTASEMH